MPEVNAMRWVGIRPTRPAEDIPIKTGAAGPVDINIAANAYGNIPTIKNKLKLEELFFTNTPLAAGASISTPKIYRLDYNRLTILIGADKVGKFIIKPYNYRGTLLPTEFVGDVAVEVINYKYDISANYVILTYENGAVAQTKFAFLVEGEIV